MAKFEFSDEFKLESVEYIVERGYSVTEVYQRLGIITHPLYAL